MTRDQAYCLLGIFDVSMPALYGEGRERAMARLEKELDILSQKPVPPLHAPQPPKPTPRSTVPFRRDRNFVDVGTLDDLKKRCSEQAARTALVGLGGLGKSQLAIEFSYRVQENNESHWVFWVHAGSDTRFREGYTKIATATQLPGYDKSDTDILTLVYDWLSNEANGRWVMIIDNADDPDVFFGRSGNTGQAIEGSAAKQTQPLADFIPQSPNGAILITSRSQDVAFRLTGSNSDIILVNPMDENYALTLLRRKLGGTQEVENEAKLVRLLDYMPLAISQAAAYISQTPRMTVLKYLQTLQRGDQDRARLLIKDLGDARRDGRASNSVITTWHITFSTGELATRASWPGPKLTQPHQTAKSSYLNHSSPE